MKHKPDETPDQWVRQTLSQLPDTPPPGSSFDPERVWGQLQPELQATPTRQRTGLAWWLAAACLAGLVFGWFWLYPSSDDRTRLVAHTGNRKANEPVVVHHKPSSAEATTAPQPVFSTERKPVLVLRIRRHHQKTPAPESTPQLTEPSPLPVHTPELQTSAEMPPIVGKLPELARPSVAKAMPKRRFRVVHENELRAEEEARSKLYRTEHFVRLGTGWSEEPAPEERQPTLIMPLTTKPTH